MRSCVVQATSCKHPAHPAHQRSSTDSACDDDDGVTFIAAPASRNSRSVSDRWLIRLRFVERLRRREQAAVLTPLHSRHVTSFCRCVSCGAPRAPGCWAYKAHCAVAGGVVCFAVVRCALVRWWHGHARIHLQWSASQHTVWHASQHTVACERGRDTLGCVTVWLAEVEPQGWQWLNLPKPLTRI